MCNFAASVTHGKISRFWSRTPWRSLAKELEWVRSSPKARQAKSKARIQAYEEMANKAERETVSCATIRIPPGPRLGNKVLEAEKLRKGFGNNLLIDDLDFKLPPGGIVGVIGPNGAGKSTLFKMILDQEKPDAGTLELGDTTLLRCQRGETTGPNPLQTGSDPLRRIGLEGQRHPARLKTQLCDAFAGAWR